MDCWEDLEKSFNEYRERKDDRAFTEIFSKLQQYLLIKARAAQAEAKITGVYIPYEDFYSNFSVAAWHAIEDYPDIKSSSLKNVLSHRLYYAKCEVWRTYKKKSDDCKDKNGNTYDSTRWSDIDDHLYLVNDGEEITETELFLAEQLKNYSTINKTNYQVICLLIFGYTPAEALLKLGLAEEYNIAARKKIQRIRNSFREFIERT
ncbi:BacL2 family protein [Enterococcus sp. CSURQ0835]|uniref:BacL2 family protein n=1 Tax=Enterococcus sp. CSURQ0835 TaxID=2681394 RepID=UPI00135A1B34|nr:BacL2 family protein [Enterococcus sp. CSURQ0835]